MICGGKGVSGETIVVVDGVKRVRMCCICITCGTNWDITDDSYYHWEEQMVLKRGEGEGDQEVRE